MGGGSEHRERVSHGNQGPETEARALLQCLMKEVRGEESCLSLCSSLPPQGSLCLRGSDWGISPREGRGWGAPPPCRK